MAVNMAQVVLIDSVTKRRNDQLFVIAAINNEEVNDHS